jgi:hypothetical protein
MIGLGASESPRRPEGPPLFFITNLRINHKMGMMTTRARTTMIGAHGTAFFAGGAGELVDDGGEEELGDVVMERLCLVV